MTVPMGSTLAAFSLLLLAIAVGCNESPVAEKTPTPTESSASSSPSSDVPEVDPMTQELTANSTAKDVCERFMLLLQSGKRFEAETLLSRRANQTITEVGLELELGGGNSKITVSDASYATSLAKVAQVTSHIGTGDDAQEFTWMLRKTKPGWRITGLVIEGKSGPDLHSFESRLDVTSIQKSMGGPAAQTNPGSTIRQVSATDQE